MNDIVMVIIDLLGAKLGSKMYPGSMQRMSCPIHIEFLENLKIEQAKEKLCSKSEALHSMKRQVALTCVCH